MASRGIFILLRDGSNDAKPYNGKTPGLILRVEPRHFASPNGWDRGRMSPQLTNQCS